MSKIAIGRFGRLVRRPEFLGTALVVLTVQSASAQTAKTIARRAYAATVLVTVGDAQGHTVAQGSGFFVGPGQVATSLHVIEGATIGSVKLVGDHRQLSLEGVIAVDGEHDLVVLKTQWFAELDPPAALVAMQRELERF